MTPTEHIGIIGAGPAGLTAAYLLAKKGWKVSVFEADETYVGGISRTESYKDFYFDIGGHRFFSKSKEVEDFWQEILADDLIIRNRKSRIVYNGKFYSYPLKAFEALNNLGIVTSAQCMLSYLMAKLSPIKNPKNFEDWVSNQFGKKLFRIFFKTYTEKVWGMDTKTISADWAAQRIKGLSLGKALYNAFFTRSQTDKSGDEIIKTLIDRFKYPKKGPGMLWEKCAEKIKEMGGEIHMNSKIDKITSISEKYELTNQRGQTYSFDQIISSMPLSQFIQNLQPGLTTSCIEAAKSIKYRDFLTVVLMAEDKDYFDDNWLYIHDDSVKVGRIQNFKAWSPHMVPDSKFNCYGLEYFCFEGDGLWNKSNEELIELGKKEMAKLGLINTTKVFDGYVVRQPKAYPVYDDNYHLHIETIRQELEKQPKLQVIGRNGMHKYNNQDHSMMTAMLAVENILAARIVYNLWQVNEDAEYHESGNAGEHSFESGRMIPKKLQ